MDVRVARLRQWLWAILVLAIVGTGAAQAQPACGGQGQRPCRVWERIPSCNKGLLEDFAKNVCIRPNACGAVNQRPCNIVERVPSCNSGLVEDFVADRCVRPGDLGCGREGQRPCLIVERVPSCNSGLVEDFRARKCVAPGKLSCGREGQRPCLIVERVPACDAGLKEDFVKGSCIRPDVCGANGQRPCNIVERVPSCNGGLAEDFVLNQCVPAAPLGRAVCMTAVGLAQRQSDASAIRIRADQAQVGGFLNANPEVRKAIQSAIDTLIRREAPQIDNLVAIALVLSQPEYLDLRRSIGDKESVCLKGKIDFDRVRAEVARNPGLALRGVASATPQVGADPVLALLEKGAITLSGEIEANAVAGLASSLGPVLTYDAGGAEHWGFQLSSQVQLITEISAGGGVQVGWWPGSALAPDNSLRSIVGERRDGELAGPYISGHGGASGGFMGRAGVALDFIFEVPDRLSDLTAPSWYLDNFSGVTVTVSASADPTPAPFKPSGAVALGNTLTVSVLDR